MSAELLRIAFVVMFAVTTSCSVQKLSTRQIRNQQKACHCVCGYVEASWPWDYPGVLHDNESEHTAWGGGSLVCAYSEERHPARRIQEIQIQLWEIDCARGNALSCADLGRARRGK